MRVRDAGDGRDELLDAVAACAFERNVGKAVAPGGMIYIVGHILEDSRIAPAAAVGFNLVFLNVYDAGRARSEGEHRSGLAEAGFVDVEIRYRVAPADASILVARKAA